ncbi:MAG: zinc-binding alcohol dehydrogenase family protein [Chitinophagaceae bacterium]|nr:MAG: zinc-binding alcohol dehydrogenase family protein [Chitinophagaceae bacterium]
MRTLVCTEPGTFTYTDGQEPALQKGRAIIKVKRIGICGTDIHAFEGTQPYFTYPRILGHELSGELVAFDEAPGFAVGDPVSFIPYYHCGHCIACRRGKPNCCVHMQVCGVHVNGGMVEYLSVPSASLLQGKGLAFDELALLEPLAVSAHGVRRAAVEKDEFVLVIGAGPIGLGAMLAAQLAGARVIVMDTNKLRLCFAKENLQVPFAVDAAAADVYEQINAITGGDMPTVVIDATGSQAAINGGFRYLAHGGRYVLIGLQKGDISFSHPEFHKREAALMSSRNATRQDFEAVMAAIKDGKISPKMFITHRTRFDEVKEVFPTWLNPSTSVVKAMVEMP